jgi:hypothetical protein
VLGLLGALLTVNVIVNRTRAKVDVATAALPRSGKPYERMETLPNTRRLHCC